MKFFLPVFFLLISFIRVSACSYFANPEPPMEYIAAKTETIFIGEVISKTVFEEKLWNGKNIVQRIRFRVKKALKGIKAEIIEINLYEKKRKTSCDEPAPTPEMKEEWMIFQGYDEGDYQRRFVRYVQGLSFKVDAEKHKDFIARLDRYTQNPPTAIYGQIDHDCMLSACLPLEGVEITIAGDYIKLQSKTDQNGKFGFENIPPGKYKVSINLPFKTSERFMNWTTKKDSIFDEKAGQHIYEHETGVRFRDANYYYFVFDRPASEQK